MEARKAAVAVLYNGAVATAAIEKYLRDFKYTDVDCGSSDSITMVLNGPDRLWINSWFPQKGDQIKPTVRLTDWDGGGSRYAFECGTFCVDDFGFTGGPVTLTIGGVAIQSQSSFKTTKRTITYESTTLKEIGAAVAARAGIALFYEAGTISVERVEQNGQSDCEFFNALLVKYGLALKIYNNRLVVFSEAAYEAAQPVATLTETDFEPGWTWNTTVVGTYTGIEYSYTNSDKNKTFTVKAGGGNRLLTSNEAAENLTEATIIALAALNNANKVTTTMKLTLKARRGIIATSCIQITGLGKLDGKYYVERVEHSIGSGYKQSVSLRKVEQRFTKATSYSSDVSEG